ncbi:hypothetical protein CRUP_027584 [Coryphaenoides rupestris]|nr:hypothetical protein CRUP_027584 [Coryphaenoides rupestris]
MGVVVVMEVVMLACHVRFIDYEYSSYNYQAFDIGNHFNEFAGMSELDYGLYPKPGDAAGVAAGLPEGLQAASHFFWGFWALIQAKYSSIDFDFLG